MNFKKMILVPEELFKKLQNAFILKSNEPEIIGDDIRWALKHAEEKRRLKLKREQDETPIKVYNVNQQKESVTTYRQPESDRVQRPKRKHKNETFDFNPPYSPFPKREKEEEDDQEDESFTDNNSSIAESFVSAQNTPDRDSSPLPNEKANINISNSSSETIRPSPKRTPPKVKIVRDFIKTHPEEFPIIGRNVLNPYTNLIMPNTSVDNIINAYFSGNRLPKRSMNGSNILLESINVNQQLQGLLNNPEQENQQVFNQQEGSGIFRPKLWTNKKQKKQTGSGLFRPRLWV